MSQIRTIDLNCDVGEGTGHDAALMPYISSANIACGGHAGDEATMRATVEHAMRHGVAIGAHPGFEDRLNFGRRELPLSAADVHELVGRQVGALCRIGPVRHVKPHGALYNLAARDREIAAAIAEAVVRIDPALLLFGLAGGELLKAGKTCGLRVVGEAFADRRYGPDASLVSRTNPDAMIDEADQAVEQALLMITKGVVRSVGGKEVSIHSETICIHGDGPDPVLFARSLRARIEAAGIRIHAP